MDLVIGLLWFLAFSVIILVLGALNYFLKRSYSDINLSDKTSQGNTASQQQQQQQSNGNKTSNNRRKNSRNTNKKQQQVVPVAINEDLNSDDNNNNEDKQKIKLNSSEIKIEKEEEEELLINSSVEPTNEEQEENEEFQDPMKIEEVLTSSSSLPIQDEQKPILPVKKRKKTKSNHANSKSSNSSKEDAILPLKPQASIAPVKQFLPLISITNIESNQILQDNKSKSNEKYSYSEHNSLPPRFQQQRQQKNAIALQKLHNKKKSTKISSIPLESAARQNDFIPSISKQQNDYSSESDILNESPSTKSQQYSLKNSNLIHSLSSSNIIFDKLISIFDTTLFSSDELQLILNKITTKNLLNKQTQQYLSLTTNDKTIERIIEETYRSQTKIFQIELQTEKNRVLELSKINTDMDNTIRQLQQSNKNMLPYQQTILSYQMQIKRITDENTRLIHQLHNYSIMPATINELKQQQIILNEQIKQITIRNSNLEKELADGQRATKQAADIYKKVDIQKQERIDQLMIDINKYKKIEKDLNIYQIKHNEFEKNLNLKLNDITQQRDDLQKSCEQLKLQYVQNQTSNHDQLQQELNDTKAKNDLLRQRNWKIMEQLNKRLHEQKQNQPLSL